MRDGNITKKGKSENESLDSLVKALCCDFSRRKKIIESGGATKRTQTELRYLNLKIFAAAAEIAGDEFAAVYIEEIGREIGYAKSEAFCVSELTYKRYKSLIKENIAKKLHLSD